MQYISTQSKNLYERDYYRWLTATVELLRSGRLHELDIENLVEELDDLGRSERRALESNLRVLLMHLLKWEYQPEKRSGSWKATIREHRTRIKDLLTDSPSLRPYFHEVLPSAYQRARKLASDETGLPEQDFPGAWDVYIGINLKGSQDNMLLESFLPGRPEK
jgi:hypothetical protein